MARCVRFAKRDSMIRRIIAERRIITVPNRRTSAQKAVLTCIFRIIHAKTMDTFRLEDARINAPLFGLSCVQIPDPRAGLIPVFMTPHGGGSWSAVPIPLVVGIPT